MKKPIYLDYAAATPVDKEVLAVMRPYFVEKFHNPSANYQAAVKIRQALELARSEVAGRLGAKAGEIVFTAGGTEANNLAIQGVMQKLPGCNLIVSAVEHESVLAPAEKYDQKIAAVDKDGRLDIAKLLKHIDDKTVLVSVMYANNEVGTIQPIPELARALDLIKKDRRRAGLDRPLYLHTDAAQAGNYLDLHAARLDVDLMTVNGGKIYGPKQSGVLFAKAGVLLEPQILGGGQERGLRSGTENIAGVIGLAAALKRSQSLRQAESLRLAGLQKLFLDLVKRQLPAAIINGSLTHRLPNNVHITLPGQDNERLLFKLDEAGIMAAAGSACSASSEEPSHVLKAMGISRSDAQASLRFTMGCTTSESDVRETVRTLAGLL